MLGDVANLSVTRTGWVPQETDLSGAQLLLTQDGLEKHRLTRTVCPNHSNELTGLNLQVQISPKRALAKGKRCGFDAENAVHLVDRLLHLVNNPSHPVQIVQLLNATAIS